MNHLANIASLAASLSEAVRSGAEPAVGKWVNGRIVAVLGSPELGNATDLAIGMSALRPGTSTPTHDHRAEEIAIVLAGTGEIQLGSEVVAVTQGDIVRTPAYVPHQTRAAADHELQVLWIYAPAGSESRWLQSSPEE